MFSPEMLIPMGPPPQAVLDQRFLWHVLQFLFGVSLVLRLLGLDIAGALLSALMLSISVIMTRDGMTEMGKYALVFAILCALNFFFDVLPLILDLGGRVSRHTTPISSSTSEDGARTVTYKLTTKTTPFFDLSQGFRYNAQSAAMLVSPLAMALGVYLAITAHNQIQAQSQQPLLDDEWRDFGRQPVNPDREVGSGGAAPALAQARSSFMPQGRQGFESFHGQSHRLSDCPDSIKS